MEEDDFVFVDGDDAVSVSSSRSSLFLVEDPSTDALMLHGEEPSPLKKVASAPPPEDNEPAPKDALQSLSVVEGDPPVRDAPKEEALPQEQPKFVCSSCRSTLLPLQSCALRCLHSQLSTGARQSDIIWEGYMGANKSAYLFSKVVNLEPAAEPRKQQLSTGFFLLQDVRCKSCSTAFGWTYLKAWNQDQKYKEGSTIVQQSLLQLVGDSPSESTTTAVHC